MTTPDVPEMSPIPDEAKLYERLVEVITPYAGPSAADEIAETVMAVFADHLRVQVDHFTRLAAGQPTGSPAGRATANAYQAAAGHLRLRADELAGGAS